MNIDEKAVLYGIVQKAVSEDPSTVKLIMEAVNNGILTAAEEARQRAIDFETIAMLAVTFNKGKKDSSELKRVIQEKIKVHKKNCHFVWDSFLGKKDGGQ